MDKKLRAAFDAYKGKEFDTAFHDAQPSALEKELREAAASFGLNLRFAQTDRREKRSPDPQCLTVLIEEIEPDPFEPRAYDAPQAWRIQGFKIG